jgi:hypothetical protein
MCIFPSRPPVSLAQRTTDSPRWADGVLSITAGAVLGIVMVVAGVLFVQHYGFALFFGAPFGMGTLTAFLFNRNYPSSLRQTTLVTIAMFVSTVGALFFLAFEGAICIAMAIPLGAAICLLGAAVGRTIALRRSAAVQPVLPLLLLLPLAAVFEPAALTTGGLHEVRSAVIINAPPGRVWPRVIAFSPIAEPRDAIFRLGIAYPTHATIEGTGVGAVRYCYFSTGAFVEPITTWEPGRRLSFDVTSSPPPLRELSVYSAVSPPHLDSYLRSRRGEFRLVPLDGGRTRLEGSTWYEVDMAPQLYWRYWSDLLIRRIHHRVLDHIKHEAEAS